MPEDARVAIECGPACGRAMGAPAADGRITRQARAVTGDGAAGELGGAHVGGGDPGAVDRETAAAWLGEGEPQTAERLLAGIRTGEPPAAVSHARWGEAPASVTRAQVDEPPAAASRARVGEPPACVALARVGEPPAAASRVDVDVSM